MLTYLFLCFKSKMHVVSYEDHAEGTLEKLSPGKFWVKDIVLRPHIRFSGADTQQGRAMAIRLVHEAHDNCFIAQSIKSSVSIEPQFMFL